MESPNWEVYWAVLNALEAWQKSLDREQSTTPHEKAQIQRLARIIELAEKRDLSEMSRNVWKSVQATQLCTTKQARSIAIGCAKALAVEEK